MDNTLFIVGFVLCMYMRICMCVQFMQRKQETLLRKKLEAERSQQMQESQWVLNTGKKTRVTKEEGVTEQRKFVPGRRSYGNFNPKIQKLVKEVKESIAAEEGEEEAEAVTDAQLAARLRAHQNKQANKKSHGKKKKSATKGSMRDRASSRKGGKKGSKRGREAPGVGVGAAAAPASKKQFVKPEAGIRKL